MVSKCLHGKVFLEMEKLNPKDITVFEFESSYNLPNHLIEDVYKLVILLDAFVYCSKRKPDVMPLNGGLKGFMNGICEGKLVG